MIKFAFRISVLISISLLIYYIPEKYWKLDYFTIKKINILGDTKISTRELTELGKITYNSNIWYDLNFSSIENLLLEDVRISKASVFSNTLGELTFDIEESDIFCYAQIDNRIHLVNEKGEVFGFLSEKDKKNVPLVILNEDNNEKRMLQASKFIDIIKVINETNLKELVSQIYQKDENLIILILTDGTNINTNTVVDKEKYKILEVLYYELIRENKIQYIDLRFEDFVVKKVGDS